MVNESRVQEPLRKKRADSSDDEKKPAAADSSDDEKNKKKDDSSDDDAKKKADSSDDEKKEEKKKDDSSEEEKEEEKKKEAHFFWCQALSHGSLSSSCKQGFGDFACSAQSFSCGARLHPQELLKFWCCIPNMAIVWYTPNVRQNDIT